jgi:1-acyl-sn-glycerol-3-phosphate acyltransferase
MNTALDISSANSVLEAVKTVALELHPGSSSIQGFDLDNSIERDFGIDSLGRVELATRLEDRFELHVPNEVIFTADTPRQLLNNASKKPLYKQSFDFKTKAELHLPTLHEIPDRAKTILEVLDWHVEQHPERPYIYFLESEDKTRVIHFGELKNKAEQVASLLQENGVDPGNRVALMLPTCMEYFQFYLGILLANAIPVPIYPPNRISQIEEHLKRQVNILSNAGVSLLVAPSEAKNWLPLIKAKVKSLEVILTIGDLSTQRTSYLKRRVEESDSALIQYTAGSTGNPKGVVLTHSNLLTNIRAMCKAAKVTPTDVCVSWLPLYHDMGLIGAFLGSLYAGATFVVMSPLSFLSHPSHWLWAIHKYNGTVSASPNFGYELCLHRISNEEIEGLDLSSWRVAFNGAEPVSPQTIEQFAKRFSEAGFRKSTMTPVYGLAEASLGVCFSPIGREPRIDIVNREAFQKNGRAEPASGNKDAPLSFVSCGIPLPGQEVRIVDSSDREVEERQEGSLQFRGASSTSHYFKNESATRELLHGDWLDSGDLGYIANGEIYVTGRRKEIIIRAGRNIYPYDLEEAVGELTGVRKGCVAVFGLQRQESGTEKMIIALETRIREKIEKDQLQKKIIALSVDLTAVAPDEILFLPPHTIPKTSSGKIRRSFCKELYQGGELGRQRNVTIQILRLTTQALLSRIKKFFPKLSQLLFNIYAWGLVASLGSLAWILTWLLPYELWRKSAVRKLAQAIFHFGGISVYIEGAGKNLLESSNPVIFVSNHTSYTDAILLTALLPLRACFAVKEGLAKNYFLAIPIRRLGHEFVERFDPGVGNREVDKLMSMLAAGKSLVIFAEGTFRRSPGLQAFHLGAFITSTRTQVPIVPIAINGTRSLLRGEQLWFRKIPIKVTIGNPIKPMGNTWDEALRLRDECRSEILKHCREPEILSHY